MNETTACGSPTSALDGRRTDTNSFSSRVVNGYPFTLGNGTNGKQTEGEIIKH